METQLSEPLKAILLKVAMELKRNYRWIPDIKSNEIDIFQGHLSMFKEYIWEGGGETPNVDVSITIDMHFKKNEQNNVYFLAYNAYYSLWIEGVGGTDREEYGDVEIPFTENDVNNISKFIDAAKKINQQSMDSAEEFAYNYSQESSQEFTRYRSEKGWKEPED